MKEADGTVAGDHRLEPATRELARALLNEMDRYEHASYEKLGSFFVQVADARLAYLELRVPELAKAIGLEAAPCTRADIQPHSP